MPGPFMFLLRANLHLNPDRQADRLKLTEINRQVNSQHRQTDSVVVIKLKQ